MLEILEQEEINFEEMEDGSGRAVAYYKNSPDDEVWHWEVFSPSLNESDFIEHVRRVKRWHPNMVKKPVIVKEDFWEEE